jgi:hypothetical protein
VTGSQTGVAPEHKPPQGSDEWHRLLTQFCPAAQHTPLHITVEHAPAHAPFTHDCPAPQQLLPQACVDGQQAFARQVCAASQQVLPHGVWPGPQWLATHCPALVQTSIEEQAPQFRTEPQPSPT